MESEKYNSEILEEETKRILIGKKMDKPFKTAKIIAITSWFIFALIVLIFENDNFFIISMWLYFGVITFLGLAFLFMIVALFIARFYYRPRLNEQEILKQYNTVISQKIAESKAKINILQKNIDKETEWQKKLIKF
jgi:hypothetical protein